MSPPIPLVDLRAQYLPLRDEMLAALARVCDSQRFILGPEVSALEEELARLIGVGHAVAVSSGTDALTLALMALDIGVGDEVITSVYSFFATAGAIVRVGARPVFVDIDPATFNLDPAGIARRVTRRTKAVLPVHLFGLCADMDGIRAEASRAGVPVIEDAAQAIGASFGSRQAGSLGALGCFSFFPAKNLGAFGDAGLVTTDDAGLAAQVRLLRNHGMEATYEHAAVGGNFRMDAIQAAVLRVKAPHLEAWTEARRLNAARYRRLMREMGVEGAVALPVEPPGSRHVFHQFVIRVSNRERLRKHLDARGIGNAVYYPVPFHLQPCFAGLDHHPGDFPVAELAARTSLALPIYGELTLEQQRTIVEAIAEVVSPGSAGVA